MEGKIRGFFSVVRENLFSINETKTSISDYTDQCVYVKAPFSVMLSVAPCPDLL